MALAAEIQELPAAVHEEEPLKVRAPLSGWLLKRKNNKAMLRVISSTNRRYFTLDFDTQVLYYSHAENSKSVSQPVAFRHILSVEPLAVKASGEGSTGDEVTAAPTPMQRQGSKNSVGSGFSRLGKILSKRPSVTEEHGLTLHLAGKDMELLCTSQAEAETWFDAVKEAIAVGSSEKCRSSSMPDNARAPSTAPGSSQNSPPSPRSEAAPQDSDDEQQEDQMPLDGTLVVGSPGVARKLSEEVAASKESATFIQVASNQVHATTETEVAPPEETPVVMAPEETPSASAETTAQDDDALVVNSERSEPKSGLPPRMPTRSAAATAAAPIEEQAMKPSSAASDGEVEEEVLAIDNTAAGAVANNATAWGVQDAADNDGMVPQKSVSSRYADKGEGLSLAQRLSQLDFSDDEDEEAGAKEKTEKDEVQGAEAAKRQEAGGFEQEGVLEEGVQAFVQDADSEDE